ncbi:BspA family leucine-rich repeat surface protein, partial [Carnobacterium maltaromaticum]|uniref:BspA family leucine-rich repeat surface protein n=1 Tax=Carnobacterium maltaromaticum TaxID=2751 RepID=UPI00191BC4A8
MKLKRRYLLIFIVVMGVLAVSQVRSLLANYNIVEDMSLTASIPSLKEGETLTVSVTDSNVEDTKLVIPVDENTEYMASDYQDASVVFDQINHQVVIDWLEPSKEQKEVTVQLKMTKEGSYPLKALTVRENQEVSTKEENIEVIALEELKEEPKEESLDTEIDESSQESLTEGPTSEKLDNTDKEASALWGTCPWNFDKENGILTIEPGELGTVKESPWNVCNKVAYSSIKKIVFTGKTVAPIDSSYLFTNESVSVLSNIEEIEGIPYLDTSKTMNMSYMFYNLRKVKDLDVGNFETGNVTNMMYMFEGTKIIKTLDISKWNTGNVTHMGSMFGGMSNIQSIDVSKWNTGNVTHMGGMFSGMSNIQSIDVSKWNTGNVKSMHGMFSGMSNIQSLDLSNFDTGNVTSMESMFSSMINIQNLDLSNFDTENVKTMRMMFYSMTNLLELDIGNFNTKNVRNFQRMFEEVLKLKSLDVSKFDTGNGTLMDGMFAHMASVENLNVSNFKTGNVTNMSNMFREMSNIQSLDFSNFDTENVTDMSNMFYRCNIKNLNFSNFETRNVTNMSNMFREMSNVQSLNLSNFDTKNVTNMSNMFYRNSIRNLDFSNFDTEKVTNMNGMLREISLNKLILGKKFKFGVLVGLSAPTYLNGNDRLTGKWIREDGESKGYSPTDFMANYGTNDLTPGAYVGEIIPRGKITGEAKLTNQTHSAGLFYVNDKVKLENVIHHEGEIWNPLYKTVIPEELTVNQESFKGYMILEGGDRVDLPNEVFKFDESSRLFEMNLKSIMEPSGNDNYYSKVDFDVYYEVSATLNKDAIGGTFKIETTINYFNPLLEKYKDVKLTTKNSDIYGLEPEWTLEKEIKNLSRSD